MLLPVWGSVFVPCFAVHCFFPVYLCNHLAGEEKVALLVWLPGVL